MTLSSNTLLPFAFVGLASTLPAQSVCPSTTYIRAGCASTITGEKPLLSVLGDYSVTTQVFVKVEHTGQLGVAAILAGQETAPVVVDGCTLVTTGAEIIAPLVPDSNGDSFIEIPLLVALGGDPFVVQATEYETPTDSWIVSDGMKVEFAPLCVSIQNLVDSIQPGGGLEAERAYYDLLKRPSEDVFPVVLTALQQEIASPTTGGICGAAKGTGRSGAGYSTYGLCPSRLIAFAYLLESFRSGSAFPYDSPDVTTTILGFNFGPLPTEAEIGQAYVNWAQGLASYQYQDIHLVGQPLAPLNAYWSGINYVDGGLDVSTYEYEPHPAESGFLSSSGAFPALGPTPTAEPVGPNSGLSPTDLNGNPISGAPTGAYLLPHTPAGIGTEVKHFDPNEVLQAGTLDGVEQKCTVSLPADNDALPVGTPGLSLDPKQPYNCHSYSILGYCQGWLEFPIVSDPGTNLPPMVPIPPGTGSDPWTEPENPDDLPNGDHCVKFVLWGGERVLCKPDGTQVSLQKNYGVVHSIVKQPGSDCWESKDGIGPVWANICDCEYGVLAYPNLNSAPSQQAAEGLVKYVFTTESLTLCRTPSGE